MEKKVLGKGLSALLSVTDRDRLNAQKMSNLEMSNLESSASSNVKTVKLISILENRLQPRQNYDESRLEDLKASIKEKGVLQPILVRKQGEHYEVVAGERRLRAAKAIGLQEVPVIIKNVTDRESLVLALVENIQREDLNAIEEGLAFKKLIDEFKFTMDEVAEAVGKDRATVHNLIRLLKLPQDIQQQVIDAEISMGHARAILGLGDAAIQKKMAQAVIDKGLSVRQIEDMVKQAQQGHEAVAGAKARPRNRDIEILEEELRKILGTKVFIKDRRGKGKLVIEYYTLDDLDRILGVLRQ